MTKNLRPEAAKRYETEEQELAVLMDRYRIEPVSMTAVPALREEAARWLDATLYRHREQAYAEGMLDTQRAAPSWWDRNWFGVVLLGLIIGVLIVIGLVNGWS